MESKAVGTGLKYDWANTLPYLSIRSYMVSIIPTTFSHGLAQSTPSMKPEWGKVSSACNTLARKRKVMIRDVLVEPIYKVGLAMGVLLFTFIISGLVIDGPS